MEDYVPYSNKFHKIYLCAEIRNFKRTYDYHTPMMDPSPHTIRAIAAMNSTYTMGTKSYQEWIREWNPEPEESKEEP